jgi:hypothetical protein
MPNRKAHVLAGTVTGLVAAAIDIPSFLTPAERMLFLAGAAVGGAVGGRLPDVLEPASSPHHRQACHGIVPVGTVAVFIGETLSEIVKDLLGRAQSGRSDTRGSNVPPIERAVWVFAAGFVKGLGPGYLSHLVLDGCTPCGLPLFGRFN